MSLERPCDLMVLVVFTTPEVLVRGTCCSGSGAGRGWPRHVYRQGSRSGQCGLSGEPGQEWH